MEREMGALPALHPRIAILRPTPKSLQNYLNCEDLLINGIHVETQTPSRRNNATPRAAAKIKLS